MNVNRELRFDICIIYFKMFSSESDQQKYSRQDGEAVAKELTREFYILSVGVENH